jgi:uncharacterized protein (DUF2147 family)
MRHYACAAVIGVLSAAIFAPVNSSHAASADPSGYWVKPDAERESKIQVFKCGSGRTQLCAKIAWLKEPNDSKGQPLHDVRNEDPSRRGRPIVGLQLFTGLTASAPGTWNGSIYNPEDGHTYTATVTLVSRNQITLRGCKAWLLCGEKQWLRTSAPEVTPSVPAAGAEQIEASAEPQTPSSAAPAASLAATEPVAPSDEANTAKAPIEATAAPSGEVKTANAPIEAAAEPAAEVKTANAPIEASAAPVDMPMPASANAVKPEPASMPKPAAPIVQETASPAEAPAEIGTRNGYRFLTVSTDPDTTARLSDENVSSMFFMAKPVATKTAEPAPVKPAAKAVATQSPGPAALPAAKPKVQPNPVATAAAKPAPKTDPSAKPAEQAAATPQETNTAQADAEGTDSATTADATPAEPLTRRQRRLLRRQQREQDGEALLPWLRQ